jgi:uncharacterized protein with HEPN domain
MPRDKVILLDIRNTGMRIIEFVRDMDETVFLEDAKTQSAVLHQLMVLGEAVKRLSGEFRTLHQDVPWSLIAGMRDHLFTHTTPWISRKSGEPQRKISPTFSCG